MYMSDYIDCICVLCKHQLSSSIEGTDKTVLFRKYYLTKKRYYFTKKTTYSIIRFPPEDMSRICPNIRVTGSLFISCQKKKFL